MMTGRTWPDPQSQKHERIRFDEILAGLCNGQARPQRGRTSKKLALLKSVFACAMTVMDKVEGWNEEEWGSRLAVCMCVYTEAVLCDGQGPRKKT